MTTESAPDRTAVAFRSATAGDINAIAALIVSGNLPPFFIEEFLPTFLVAERHGALMATGGVEVYGDCAVLRSIVVAEAARGLGLGRQLAERLTAIAVEAGCAHVYLFTQDAHAFWQHLGFEDVALDQWQEAPRICWQYQYIAHGAVDAPMGETTRQMLEAFTASNPDPTELGEIFSMWKRV